MSSILNGLRSVIVCTDYLSSSFPNYPKGSGELQNGQAGQATNYCSSRSLIRLRKCNHVKCTANATLNGLVLASYKRDRCNLDGANCVNTTKLSRRSDSRYHLI